MVTLLKWSCSVFVTWISCFVSCRTLVVIAVPLVYCHINWMQLHSLTFVCCWHEVVSFAFFGGCGEALRRVLFIFISLVCGYNFGAVGAAVYVLFIFFFCYILFIFLFFFFIYAFCSIRLRVFAQWKRAAEFSRCLVVKSFGGVLFPFSSLDL